MTVSKQKLPLKVNMDDSIAVVKQRLEDEYALPAETIILTFCGLSMRDGRELGDYGVANASTIQVVSMSAARVRALDLAAGTVFLSTSPLFLFVSGMSVIAQPPPPPL